jgi:hypothetical protein
MKKVFRFAARLIGSGVKKQRGAGFNASVRGKPIDFNEWVRVFKKAEEDAKEGSGVFKKRRRRRRRY